MRSWAAFHREVLVWTGDLFDARIEDREIVDQLQKPRGFISSASTWQSSIIDLASQYGRYGYRRITALLRDGGWHVNHKRVERIWRREGLKVPAKQPKRGRLWLNDGSCIRLRPCWQNHVWAYDFVQARTHDGRAFRMLT